MMKAMVFLRLLRAAGAALILTAFAAAPPAVAQSAEGARTGWHTVRAGETLIGITRDYLGSKTRWRENLELNPGIENPHVLRPGQRLRVLLAPAESVPTAQVVTLTGKVENKPAPLPWNETVEQDLLIERDGIRTYASSSSELVFLDGTEVTVSEDSLVYLRRTGRRLSGGAATPETKTVEIIDGQAEVSTGTAPATGVEVEILVGETRATARTGDAGSAQTRARRAEEGGAKVMMYGGSGEVVAAGATVELETGTGSSVPAAGPPSPAEKLLPAPRSLVPANGAEFGFPDPELSWESVPGAASYTVEVCQDPECGRLVRRAPGLMGNVVAPAPLPVATVYWRVTAVSPSGLDGYPSPTSKVVILSDTLDTEPPQGSVVATGKSAVVDGRTLYDGQAVVEVRLTDSGSGVDGWSARVNGEAVAAERLAGPWPTGEYRVEVTAVDRAGNEGPLAALEFEVDADPPRLDWEVNWVRAMLTEVRPGMATRRWLARKRRWARWAQKEFATDPQGPPWLILAAGEGDAPMSAGDRRADFSRRRGPEVRAWKSDARSPEIIFLAPGLVAGDAGVLDDGRFVWLRAEDETSGVVQGIELETAAATDGGYELVIRCEDPLGNKLRLAWPFATR